MSKLIPLGLCALTCACAKLPSRDCGLDGDAAVLSGLRAADDPGQVGSQVKLPLILPPWYPNYCLDVIEPEWLPGYERDVIRVPGASSPPECESQADAAKE